MTYTESANSHLFLNAGQNQSKLIDKYYNPTNLISSAGMSFRHKLLAALKDAYLAVDIKSKILEDFFMEVSVGHIKRHIRKALKFIIVVYFIEITLSPVVTPGSNQIIAINMLFLTLCVSTYLITLLQDLSHQVYQHMAILLSLIILSLILIININLNNPMEVLYTPAVHILIHMYAVLPISLPVCMSLAIVFTVGHEVLAYIVMSNYQSRDLPQQLFAYIAQRGNVSFDRNFKNPLNYYISAQSCLWLACHVMGFLLHFSHQMRRRASFLRLGDTVNAKRDAKEAHERQQHLIEGIMPISVISDYLKEMKHEAKFFSGHESNRMWMYTRMYKEVSILFGDFVGFTNMSSNKSAVQIVTMLNDVFQRFDQMTSLTQCEKIGTLGDCYYCVAGCPQPNPDHAICCVEMGLGMCRLILEFNQDYKENVNMRIGVHTGRVNAAILGNLRIHFDVYSFDVFVANLAESTGRAGWVHITEPTFLQVRNDYKFYRGDPIRVKAMETRDKTGNEIPCYEVKTFYVDRRTSMLLRKGEKIFNKKMEFHIKSYESEKVSHDSDEAPDMSLPDTEMVSQLDIDMIYITAMKHDPEKHIELFYKPPIWPFTLKFTDPQMEAYYQFNNKDCKEPVYIDSVRTVPLLACFSTLCYSTLIIVSVILVHMPMQIYPTYLAAVPMVQLTITAAVTWSTLTTPAHFQANSRSALSLLYRVLNNIWVLYTMLFVMDLVVFLVPLLCFNRPELVNNYYYFSSRMSVSFFCCLIPLTNQGMPAMFNSVSCIVCIVVYIYREWQSITVHDDNHSDMVSIPCAYTTEFAKGRPVLQAQVRIAFQFVITAFFVLRMSRENEKCLRLVSYVQRQAQNSIEEARQKRRDAERLLKNIIPAHVLESIAARTNGCIDVRDLSYAVIVKDAAVLFAKVSNFFDGFYCEDYQLGENSLRLLHKMISLFDDLSMKYEDVEKIKNMNDCYMAAAGLNPNLKTNAGIDLALKNAVELMDFAFAMKNTLKEFNKMYVINYKFMLTIGFNIGPVTAGIIGDKKPLFDIWGDTVNVASRMYSTAKKNTIQVVTKVAQKMANDYKFVYNDELFVKGKGIMKTHLCLYKKKD